MSHRAKLIEQAADLAMRCVADGEVLSPFIIAEGRNGSVHSLAGSSTDENLRLAQDVINGFRGETAAWVFAYDGFLTLGEERTDAIFIEVGESTEDGVRVYAQRYLPGRPTKPATRIGVVAHLPRFPARMKNTLSLTKQKERAQPGATDNPGDAQ